MIIEAGTRVSGLTDYRDGERTFGVFQTWGNAYEEFETGPGNYTVAIILADSGNVRELFPSTLQVVRK